MVSGVGDLARAAQAAMTRGEEGTALSLWQQVLSADPDHAVALLTLGDAARRAGRTEPARDLLSRAVAAAPALVPARCALANLLLHQGEVDAAAVHLAVAAEQGAGIAYVWRDIGLLRRVTGDPAGALAAFDRCLELAPGDSAASLGRSLALLRLGRWREGFDLYRHRWSVSARPPRHQQIQAWRGEDPAGKRILVWDEQGAGDTIMCVRLVRSLMAAGAQIVLEVPAALVPLFDDGRHGTVVARGTDLPPVDRGVPLLDLPGLLGLEPTGIPWPGPYIASDPVRTAGWGQRLARQGNRPRIGFSWAGNPAHPGDAWRTPGLAALRPLLERSGADWYALQVASGREQLRDSPLPAPVTDLGAEIGSWADTAAILPHLDLLITPDSALAHLAGAMGRPVWTLIATDTDWRWLEGAAKTGWYPSMRLFRQKRCGDWAGVVARVAAALPA
ncbi:tetratricopeptide repeat protein [Niveispirillum sp.]|uniref:tetratricopeptide repeat protein n=1 Tax=Niveispirillum sp. TaxID=1917217 RepID=UPI001B3DA45F|nr:tetratricopeptide repeat protein [Niveispirillum sp.]MBP7336446.1 tetratricopeptide repeat protein [Niveispirillum sp.]